jgi:hypothetical protein
MRNVLTKTVEDGQKEATDIISGAGGHLGKIKGLIGVGGAMNVTALEIAGEQLSRGFGKSLGSQSAADQEQKALENLWTASVKLSKTESAVQDWVAGGGGVTPELMQNLATSRTAIDMMAKSVGADYNNRVGAIAAAAWEQHQRERPWKVMDYETGFRGRVQASHSGGTTHITVINPVHLDGRVVAKHVTKHQLKNARSTGNVLGRYGAGQTGFATEINPNAIAR